MKNICVVTSVHVANDTRVYFKETKSLAKKYNVTYIAPEASMLGDKSIQLVDVEKPKNRVRRIFSFLSIWRLCVRQECDCYHLQDPELVIVGLLLKIFNRKKVIYDVHEDYPDYILQKEYLSKWLRKPLAYLMKLNEFVASIFFDAIIVADNFVYNRFPLKKTVIVYNFPDLDSFRLLKDKPNKKFDLIYPGSLSKQMVNIVLEVVKIIISERNEFKMLIISPFMMEGGKNWVKKRMGEENIPSKNIILLDRVPYTQVSKFIQESKVGIIPLPSTKKFTKNIPTKLFEYMYCSIPVVANDLQPSRQFVSGENCCKLVDIYDSHKTANEIVNLLENEELCNQMGYNGNKLVVDKFNWSNEEKKLYSLYSRIIGE